MKLVNQLLEVLSEDSDFSKALELERNIARWEEARMGSKIKGNAKATKGFTEMIAKAKKELKALNDKMNKAVKKDKERRSQETIEFDLGDKESVMAWVDGRRDVGVKVWPSILNTIVKDIKKGSVKKLELAPNAEDSDDTWVKYEFIINGEPWEFMKGRIRRTKASSFLPSDSLRK